MIDDPLHGWKPPEQVIFSAWMISRVRSHLTACLPEEGCGLLASTPAGRVRRHFPIDNLEHSPTRFRLDPRAHLRAMLWMEHSPARLMIIYHSHPNGPDHLSETDLAESTYLNALHMVFFRDGSRWHANLYAIPGKTPDLIPWMIGR
jgi:[CysO sulfur-carrier protein]-S-L-cysteine hydrolase